jgi:hypothetical protein
MLPAEIEALILEFIQEYCEVCFCAVSDFTYCDPKNESCDYYEKKRICFGCLERTPEGPMCPTCTRKWFFDWEHSEM